MKQPDRKSSVFELALVPNEDYTIVAELTCRYADEHSSGPGASFQSDEVYFGTKDKRTELSLTIPAKACPELPGKILETEKDEPNL